MESHHEVESGAGEVKDGFAASASNRRVFIAIGLVMALAAVAALWSSSSLRLFLAPASLLERARSLGSSPAGAGAVLLAYLVGAGLVVPINFLILSTTVLFPPLQGFLYALAGCLASSVFSFLAARLVGRQTVHRLANPKLLSWSQKAADHGILTVIIGRLLPLGPYSIVNLVAGVSHIRFRDFILGNLIALIPIVGAITLFGSQLSRAIENPESKNIAVVAAVGCILFVGGIFLVRWLSPKLRSGSENSEAPDS